MAKHYIDKTEMLQEIKLSKQRGGMTPALAKMFLRMTNEIAKQDKFRNYCYLDEMKGAAMVHLARIWHKFDETKYDNPFAYFTTVIERTFWTVREKEKTVEMTKNLLYTANGLLGSFEYEQLMRGATTLYDLHQKQTPDVPDTSSGPSVGG